MADEMNGSILIVEDDSTDAELCIRALRLSGITQRIERVENGSEAIAFLSGTGPYKSHSGELQIKLVFLDLRLMALDGLQLLKELKQNAKTSSIPVVVVTGSSDENDLVESYSLGANSCIRKPVSFEEFANVIGMAGKYWIRTNRSPSVFV